MMRTAWLLVLCALPVTVTGRVMSHGQPVLDASLLFSGRPGHVAADGRFEISATTAGPLDIRAKGFAPIHRADASGELGDLELSKVKRVQFTVAFKTGDPTLVELTDGACANLRSLERQRFNLCLEQLGPDVTIHDRESTGPFVLVGGGTAKALSVGQTWAAPLASVHVDSITED